MQADGDAVRLSDAVIGVAGEADREGDADPLPDLCWALPHPGPNAARATASTSQSDAVPSPVFTFASLPDITSRTSATRPIELNGSGTC